MIEGVAEVGTDRIELQNDMPSVTTIDPREAVQSYLVAATRARSFGWVFGGMTSDLQTQLSSSKPFHGSLHTGHALIQ